jgi:hypothetical protein
VWRSRSEVRGYVRLHPVEPAEAPWDEPWDSELTD